MIGLTSTAGLIRIMRGTLLDELKKQYVIVARAKGLSEGRIVFKYSLRIAINPLISTIGWMLPAIFSGEALVSIVLNLHTIGPLLLQALLNQDMFLAGSIVLILGFLTLVGTLVSDIMLVWVDPRIRYRGSGPLTWPSARNATTTPPSSPSCGGSSSSTGWRWRRSSSWGCST